MAEWPSNHGPINKIRLPDGCGGEIITVAVGFGSCRCGSDDYLGNVEWEEHMHQERTSSQVAASMPVNSKCRICNGPLGPALTVREMMYGTRDEFDYHQCHDCACLQISKIPEDIGKYYPENYYSFGINHKRKHWLRDMTRKYRNLHAIEGNKLLGAFLCALKAPARWGGRC